MTSDWLIHAQLKVWNVSLKMWQRCVESIGGARTHSSSDCCGGFLVVAAWDESLCSLPGAFLACCECGAKGSLGFRRLTIWNGALFNVAYAETSWLWDSSYIPPQGAPILSLTPDTFGVWQDCQVWEIYLRLLWLKALLDSKRQFKADV